MTTLSVQPPYPIFTDRDGQPLDAGYVWLGVANLSPQTNPIAVYWDAALTQPAAQPIRTINGYPANNGTPGRLYVDVTVVADDYSILVQDAKAQFVYQAATARGQFGVISSDAVSFLQAGANAQPRTVQSKLRDVVSVKDFGAVGNGLADDTVAIQNAIDSLTITGGTVFFPPGTYRIARNVGTNDRWGVKVTASNITLQGSNAFLRRFNTNISTYALAYPILFVGTPDSNVALATQNVTVQGLTFIGENTRHNVSGNAIFDFRAGIVFKNSKNTFVQNCSFTVIDSAAIWYEAIASYDYANSQYFNTTKNYQSKITNCQFVAESHATPGRALIHSINTDGIDSVIIDSNYFEWTDVCLSGESTYNTADQPETATFTYATPAGRTALGAVKRQGKAVVFTNNNCYNCSEHPAYPAMVDVIIANNTFNTDAPTICNTAPIQTRSRGIAVTGNTVIGYSSFIAITTPTSQATISGNAFYANDVEDKDGGAVEIRSTGLASYITNRAPYLTMTPMGDIVITGNVIVGPKTFTPTGVLYQNGLRVYTDAFDAVNFPDGQIININVSGNSFKYFQNYLYFIDDQYKNMIVNGNNFTAKPFTKAGFNGSTAMATKAVILLYGASLTEARYTTFTNNAVDGAATLIKSRTGAFPATTLYAPEPFSNNKLDYIQVTKTADVRDFDSLNNFRGNIGAAYLDRTYTGSMLLNALATTSGSGELKYNLFYDGTNVRFYTNDSGTFITL